MTELRHKQSQRCQSSVDSKKWNKAVALAQWPRGGQSVPFARCLFQMTLLLAGGSTYSASEWATSGLEMFKMCKNWVLSLEQNSFFFSSLLDFLFSSLLLLLLRRWLLQIMQLGTSLVTSSQITTLTLNINYKPFGLLAQAYYWLVLHIK